MTTATLRMVATFFLLAGLTGLANGLPSWPGGPAPASGMPSSSASVESIAPAPDHPSDDAFGEGDEALDEAQPGSLALSEWPDTDADSPSEAWDDEDSPDSGEACEASLSCGDEDWSEAWQDAEATTP